MKVSKAKDLLFKKKVTLLKSKDSFIFVLINIIVIKRVEILS